MASIETCPRVKRGVAHDGEFTFKALRVFSVGGGDRFLRALRTLLPDLPVEQTEDRDANVRLSVARVFSSREEYCRISVTARGINVEARDEAGARNAAAILVQIAERRDGSFVLPFCTVEDFPDASYRAMMLESSGRAWLPMETIRRHVYEMALARMNVLQFHFMENPGCTVQLDCYPDLHGYGEENLKYTKDEIRALIRYADDLGITVTPLVEVISHSVAFNHAAGIACPGDKYEHMFAVCVGQEKTYDAIERVLTEIAELFPDEVIHIGGDEYDMSAVTPRTVHWGECPHCRALSERMGYTTYRELFFYAVERVNRIVNRLGKVAMLWNADMKPTEIPAEIDRNIVIHFYRTDNSLGKEKHYGLHPDGYVDDGFAVLNSYYPETYMDLAQYMNVDKLNGWSYLTVPRVAERSYPRVIGSACCAWEDFPHFKRTLSPMILLFADRLWNADGDAVPYDAAYGRVMTRVLFGGALPKDMNVFDAVGTVLPPLKNDVLLHKNRILAPLSELRRIRSALQALSNTGHPLAAIYLEIAEEAVRVKEKEDTSGTPQKTRLQFEG